MRLNKLMLTARCAQAAHSLPEAIVATLVVGTMLVSLYAGITSGFAVVKLARENKRATEILLEQTESIRLYTWSQLQDTNTYLKPGFVEYLDPLAETPEGKGVVYSGNIRLSPATDFPAAYSNDLCVVTVSVYWTNYQSNGETVRRRQMQTLVARHGIQNYVLGR